MTMVWEEFHARRARQNSAILATGFPGFRRFFALDGTAYEDGALPRKTKELIGLAASLVLRCNDCILYHLDQALRSGATRQEIHETLNIGLIIGGSIVIPYLRFAIEALECWQPEKPHAAPDSPPGN
ncbi:MAG: carboxymuconolactone decarboxylase family protein [Candidatus Kapabacteria bacterium]|nr:carboxymuconolactone decarboxylase family protein [Candidatus Kapabacteria bacterium]MDW8224426.1 carboxymuconolactone decarboxylase family protein [Bacteroidota bacterium]